MKQRKIDLEEDMDSLEACEGLLKLLHGWVRSAEKELFHVQDILEDDCHEECRQRKDNCPCEWDNYERDYDDYDYDDNPFNDRTESSSDSKTTEDPV
jgi:hypothetical protein